MNSERDRWEHIQALLDGLEAVPEREHAAWLDAACGADDALRAEVLDLWEAEREGSAYLDDLARELAPPATDLRGRRIAAYRLLEPLGQGGMGVVYEAERADGSFDQRVALKLLQLARRGTAAHERFLAERQILAGLDHPAIARILDGGVAADGTPWFTMERIEGLPVDAYCDHHRLGVRARLELFLQICDAVEHAHRRLIVHRDLKPANVLVTADGQVKLLDFGIAKLLDQESAPGPSTGAGERLMTPEYASPEQIRGEAVTTATDVYQLGLLLHVLLTGRLPYGAGPRGPGGWVRGIGDERTARPSSTITRSRSPVEDEESVTEICLRRGLSPERLRRRLRGDLDNIVATALRKEADRRYGSADRLAQDIRRHLQGLPVTARSDTWSYRGRKFLQRHALGSAAAGLALLLAAGLAGFHTVRVQKERDRAAAQRDRAEAERDRAQAEAAKAEQMSRFLTGLFSGADPRTAPGEELTARALLDRGVQQVDRELAAQPAVQSDLLQALGRTYSELGAYGEAERLLERARALRVPLLGEQHPDVARIDGDLGLLWLRRGEYRRARDLLRSSAQRLAVALGDEAPLVAEVIVQLGTAHRSLGDYAASRVALDRALAIQSRTAGPDSSEAALVLHSLASLYIEMGDYERAGTHFERALAIYEREYGENHPVVGSTLTNLAIVRSLQGRTEGLEDLYRRGLAIQERVYGPVHPRVGSSLNNLGHFLTVSGRAEEAILVLQRALEVQAEALGPAHPEMAYPLASLGDAHLAAGRPEDARAYFAQVVAVRDAAGQGDEGFDPLLLHGLAMLGDLEVAAGEETGGLHLERALAVWRRAPPSVDAQLGPALLRIGAWLVAQARCPEALPILQQATDLRARGGGARTAEPGVDSLLASCEGTRQPLQP